MCKIPHRAALSLSLYIDVSLGEAPTLCVSVVLFSSDERVHKVGRPEKLVEDEECVDRQDSGGEDID